MNQQPVAPVTWSTQDPDGLDVVGVWKTFQGEGPYSGKPATFVRLAGCTLRCPLCDTDYTSNARRWPIEDLVEEVRSAKLLVLTGGEPLRQPIGKFVKLFLERTRGVVQIETNGSLGVYEGQNYPLGNYHHDRVKIICSPKVETLSESLIPYLHCLKYVLKAGEVDPSDGLPTSCLGYNRPPARPPSDFWGEVFIQPVDEYNPEKNKANLEAAKDSCMRFGYRLSLQLHKIIGVE